jgi:gliding motility-associated-like protein
MKKILVLSLLITFFALYSQAQSYLISQGGTVTTCSGDFYDSGDATGAYGANQNFTITFHSNNTPNTHIKMTFNSFDVDPGDTLIVYDGSTTAAAVIGKYNNNNLPPNFVDASIYNTSGDLTFRFKSNGTLNNAGWFGSLVCIPQCQDIIAAFSDAEMIPQPDDSNYVDICKGDIIKFAAVGAGPGVFPQNNALYQQDSSTSLFIWDFGDGTSDTGRIVYHSYAMVRGYDIGLTIRDIRGCFNQNYLGGRVRISDNPIAYVPLLPDMCSDKDSTFLTVGYLQSNEIVVAPIISHQSSSQRYDSVTFIPDGPNCPPGSYNTYVTFTQFLPGQTITNANDVLSVCVDIEHSFAGDLGFTLICPNGSSVVLDGNDHSGGAGLGVGYEPDGSSICDPLSNTQGTGWVYGWSQIYSQQGSLNTLDASCSFPTAIPATDTINHTGYFTPDQSFSNLIGCPLNGTWNIQITDNWGSDNGYIFWWELNLNPALLPGGWSYDVPIDTVIWTGPGIHTLNDSSAYIVQHQGGTYTYTVTIVDKFGCSYDTTVNLTVVQTPDVDLGSDTILCGNNLIYNLDAGPGASFSWNTGNPTQFQPVSNTGYYYVEVTNHNANSTLFCKNSDTVFVKVLQQPGNLDLGPDLCETSPPTLDAGNTGFLYDWNTGASTQTIVANVSGWYYVTVAEEFGFNCEKTDSIRVVVLPEPTITIGEDTTMCSHGKIYMKIKDVDGYLDQYQNSYTYLWTTEPVSVISGATSRDVNLACLEIGKTYAVTAAVKGCTTVTDIRNITSKECNISLPNVITPNGDEHNEKFEIEGIENYPGSNLKVYNRWGKKVYEVDDYNNYDNAWDGGGEAPGVYYYVLTINSGDSGDCVSAKDMSGTITILR